MSVLHTSYRVKVRGPDLRVALCSPFHALKTEKLIWQIG